MRPFTRLALPLAPGAASGSNSEMWGSCSPFIRLQEHHGAMVHQRARDGHAGNAEIYTVSYTVSQFQNLSHVNDLHGLNANSTDLPTDLQTFAPTVLWQDQGKVRAKCGFRPCLCQIRRTLFSLSPAASAMVRVLQWPLVVRDRRVCSRARAIGGLGSFFMDPTKRAPGSTHCMVCQLFHKYRFNLNPNTLRSGEFDRLFCRR
jgi:hypothetical protein